MAQLLNGRSSGADPGAALSSPARAPDRAHSRRWRGSRIAPSSLPERGVIVQLAVVLVAAALAGCGQSDSQRLAHEDQAARAAQKHDLAALSRAERKAAAARVALIGHARLSCRHARSQVGHSTPAEAHRLAVRFARGFDAEVQPGMIAACEKELAR